MFWQKGNFILPFAENVMLNLSILSIALLKEQSQSWYVFIPLGKFHSAVSSIDVKHILGHREERQYTTSILETQPMGGTGNQHSLNQTSPHRTKWRLPTSNIKAWHKKPKMPSPLTTSSDKCCYLVSGRWGCWIDKDGRVSAEFANFSSSN